MGPAPSSTCALILSDKSSGSSILQAELLKHASVRGLQKTPHQEGETLYWNKAAALLGLPQVRMIDSRVLPMDARAARAGLERLCTDNVAGYEPPVDDQELVFGGWRALTLEHGPIFLEKSPHHLHYRSALDLIVEADLGSPDITFRYLALIRDPMDTLHSMWRRWRTPPEVRQHEWVRAYRNLGALQTRVGERLRLFRYEDLVSDPAVIQEVCRFIGIAWSPEIGADLSAASVGTWRRDPGFGFRPAGEVVELALEMGYENPGHAGRSRVWPLRREATRAIRRLRKGGGAALRRVGSKRAGLSQ